MTDEEFRAMVLEAFKLQPTGDFHYPFAPNQLRHLVARAVEAERERMTVNSIHTCHSECDRPGCVAVRKAVEAEREACAEICERRKSLYWMEFDKNACDENRAAAMASEECADAIRARGESK